MHHPTDTIAHTTAFVTPVVEHWLERETVQWVYRMQDRSDDPSHNERTLLPLSRSPCTIDAGDKSYNGFLFIRVDRFNNLTLFDYTLRLELKFE